MYRHIINVPGSEAGLKSNAGTGDVVNSSLMGSRGSSSMNPGSDNTDPVSLLLLRLLPMEMPESYSCGVQYIFSLPGCHTLCSSRRRTGVDVTGFWGLAGFLFVTHGLAGLGAGFSFDGAVSFLGGFEDFGVTLFCFVGASICLEGAGSVFLFFAGATSAVTVVSVVLWNWPTFLFCCLFFIGKTGAGCFSKIFWSKVLAPCDVNTVFLVFLCLSVFPTGCTGVISGFCCCWSSTKLTVFVSCCRLFPCLVVPGVETGRIGVTVMSKSNLGIETLHER